MEDERGEARGVVEDGEDVVYSGSKIAINYCKSPQYRTIHADGAFGGVTPMGKTISLGFFSERNSLPDTVFTPIMHAPGDPLAQAINFGDDRDRENARPGIMREVEVNVLMDRQTAEQLLAWLTVRVAKMAPQAEPTKEMALDPKGVVPRPW